jgi:hypothetical protein
MARAAMPMAFVKKVPDRAAKMQVTSPMPVPKMRASPTLDPWSMRDLFQMQGQVLTRGILYWILVRRLAQMAASQLTAAPFSIQEMEMPMAPWWPMADRPPMPACFWILVFR